ncbi:MAG: GTP 3',8-cyclase MoaA [Casimicrobiaceae bacterium]|nr:GTP 3',8-cyclase MoaA [Casimicrobiaceae bacterium]MCX8098970.1 GTP 3',8-cyclase MoaA [Casimicrobiaceae bacterium]MDW8312460.1 GTP 3',8-cyclase MoaA [Burkholderiales bacterium]
MGESNRKLIPIAQNAPVREAQALSPALLADALARRRIEDARGRPLRDLRISVTDRCNFRCTYCMPKEVFGPGYQFLPRTEVLTFEEITRVARCAIALGVEKIRLTGGEPTLRRDLPTLIDELASLRTPSGRPVDLTLTTNGSTLARLARTLKAAGLQRVTVSLDSLDDAVFRAMNDVDFPVAEVLRGIEVALDAGLTPLKINMVVKRGVNDHGILDMARYFRGTGVVVRFIEYMDVGSTNGWRMDDVVPSAEVIERIAHQFPLEPIDRTYPGEVAERWRYVDGAGEIGVIASVTRAFCRDCTRLRLSTDGRLYTCLFADSGVDVRALLRGGASDNDIAALIAGTWAGRNDRYSEIRTEETARQRKIEMSFIGG